MRMNKLNWYDFTVGYLIQAHYDVVKATLIIEKVFRTRRRKYAMASYWRAISE